MLIARAGRAGVSLSDYLLQELREIAERPVLAELVRAGAKLSRK